MQPSGNHQMENQPQVVFHANRNALADTPQLAHPFCFDAGQRRFHRPQQERTRKPYMLDGLSALDGPVAVLSFTDPKKPAIIAPAGEDGEISSGYWYLIMPVRIGG